MSEAKNTGAQAQAPKPGTKEALQVELEALKAERDALKSENEGLKAGAESAQAAAEATQPEMEEIFVPRGYANDEPNLFVSINGCNYLLPKGKKSKVPAHVAREIRRSWKAQDIADQHINEMLEASK